MKKLSKLIIGSSLFLMPFFGFNKNINAQNLDFSLGAGFEIPSDATIKEYVGPMGGINANLKGNINDFSFLGGGAELHLGKKDQENFSMAAANIGIYGLYGWNVEGFSMGFGPAIYFGNYSLKEKKYSEKLKRNMWFSDSESFTGFGAIVKMAYDFPSQNKTKFGIYGKYSYCDEGDANLGTFGLGVSCKF